MSVDFPSLAVDLLQDINLLLPNWLPGGKMIGNEYTCGDISGRPGASLKVNVISGKWADFATNQKGGDLISLYAAIENITNFEAATKLGKHYMMEERPKKKAIKKPAIEEEEAKLIPPPDGTRLPNFTKKPSRVYNYKDKYGHTQFLIARFDDGDKKSFIPMSYTDKDVWVKKAWKAPRPLYNLENIHKYPSKPLLVVEGEKAADAAIEMAEGKYIVITWSGGTNAWDKADWAPLHDRNILIWPDADIKTKDGKPLDYNDQPGIKCATAIASHLKDKAKSLKIIDVSDVDIDGWDAADAYNANWSWDKFKDWAKPRAKEFGVEPAKVAKTEAVVVIEDKAIEVIEFQKTKAGVPLCNEGNAILAIEEELESHIWFDEFYNDVLTDWRTPGKVRSWDEVQDTLPLLVVLQRKFSMGHINKSTVVNAINCVAGTDVRSEPRDWLNTLVWDSKPRLETFFHDYMGTENNDYEQAVGHNFWLSIVARVFRPGCKADNMVILEGKQGRFKSTALNIIGGKWYSEAVLSISDKDFPQSLAGKFLIEISELASFNKAEASKIKQVISNANDRYRAPYAVKAKDNPRQTILVGTTNDSSYLRDHTGARRFWPIAIDTVDIDSLSKDRDMLFAEAVYLYKQGHSWHVVPDSAVEEQEKREEPGAIVDLMEPLLIGRADITPAEMMRLLNFSEVNMMQRNLLTQITSGLQYLGWHRGKRTKTKRPWYPPGTDKYGQTLDVVVCYDDTHISIPIKNFADKDNLIK